MTAVTFASLSRISSQVTTEARAVKVLPTLLTLVAGLLYLVGWLLAKAFMAVWFVLVWSALAVKVGWVEARGRDAGGG
jgi:hypothetical protein